MAKNMPIAKGQNDGADVFLTVSDDGFELWIEGHKVEGDNLKWLTDLGNVIQLTMSHFESQKEGNQ